MRLVALVSIIAQKRNAVNVAILKLIKRLRPLSTIRQPPGGDSESVQNGRAAIEAASGLVEQQGLADRGDVVDSNDLHALIG